MAVGHDLWPFIRDFKLRLLLVVVAGLLAAALDIVTAGLLIPLLQSLINPPGSPAGAMSGFWRASGIGTHLQSFGLGTLAASILLLQVLREAGLYASELLALGVRKDVDYRLRTLVMDRILHQPYARLEAQGQSSLFTVLNQFSAAGAITIQSLLQILTSGIIGLAYVASMVALSPLLSGLLFAGLALTSLVVNRLVMLQRRTGDDLADYSVRLNRFGHETIHNLPIIFFSNRDSYVSSRFDRLVRTTVAKLWSSGALASLVGPLQRSLAFVIVALAIIAYSFVAQLQDLSMSGEQLLVIIFMLIRFNAPISQINTLRAQLAVRLPQAEGMLQIIKWPAADRCPSAAGRKVAHDADIVFDHVSFSYSGQGVSALSDVSLTIRAGRTTALLGPSGSGKSTLVKLLGGLYEPDRGQILIGDVALKDADLAHWRDGIAIVSQDYHLFEGSVADNICFGKLDATSDEIVAAARAANALPFIEMLPDGFDTLIGEGGVGLSGGQRQRIQIARAIISQPRILILDEATSAQDALSEREVIDSIRSLGRAVTVVIIAHRFSTLDFADYGYVLDGGRVVEEGDFESLMQAKGLYYRMSMAQERKRGEPGKDSGAVGTVP